MLAAVGELPHLPPTGQAFAMVELRSQAGTGSRADDTVLSVDYGTQPPTVSVGRSVQLEDLQLTGLRDESASAEVGRQFACPQCGAPVDVKLASSKSITCAACHSLIDLTQGIGAELRHAVQDEPVQPLIPLGSIGQLQGVPWQVVGFQHRMGNNPTEPDGQFGWQEYLLYHRQRGFIFLVDSNDGWSVVKPTTGAPHIGPGGRSASYLGKVYPFKDSYAAATRYVVGEFYWQVSRGQQTVNRDFADGRHLLNMAQSAAEVTWSVGSQIDSDAVAAAFKLDASKALLQRADATPFSFSAGSLKLGLIVLLVIVILLVLLFSRSSCDPALQDCASGGSGYRSSGGA